MEHLNVISGDEIEDELEEESLWESITRSLVLHLDSKLNTYTVNVRNSAQGAYEIKQKIKLLCVRISAKGRLFEQGR